MIVYKAGQRCLASFLYQAGIGYAGAVGGWESKGILTPGQTGGEPNEHQSEF